MACKKARIPRLDFRSRHFWGGFFGREIFANFTHALWLSTRCQALECVFVPCLSKHCQAVNKGYQFLQFVGLFSNISPKSIQIKYSVQK